MSGPRSNVSPTDILMQFFSLPLDVTALISTTLFTSEYNTGLSIRGNYFWYIHLVEFHFLLKALLKPAAAYEGALSCAISARSGLTVMPQPEDPGVVAYQRLLIDGDSGGYAPVFAELTKRQSFLPPVPLAHPKLNVYMQMALGSGTAPTWTAGRKLTARIGFTTAPLTAQMYEEIAETWGYDTF